MSLIGEFPGKSYAECSDICSEILDFINKNDLFSGMNCRGYSLSFRENRLDENKNNNYYIAYFMIDWPEKDKVFILSHEFPGVIFHI